MIGKVASNYYQSREHALILEHTDFTAGNNVDSWSLQNDMHRF